MATHCSVLAWRIPMDKAAWWATAHGVTKMDTTEQLSTAHIHMQPLQKESTAKYLEKREMITLFVE